MWQLAVGLGLSLAWVGFGHLVFADRAALAIGWPTGSQFQHEVWIGDGAVGVVGLLCLKLKNESWTATVIGPGIFLFGAGHGHVWELVGNQDTSTENAGGVM
ncbi:MAG: hypothetical protein LUQ31_02155 [Methanoregula sp.]|nr:hypothetical protein [Methanoregula sp.]